MKINIKRQVYHFVPILLIVIIVIFLFFKNFEYSHDKRVGEYIFISRVLNVSFTLPKNYSVNYGVNSLFLTKDQKEIRIVKQSTNYNNIENYLKDLAEKNQLKIDRFEKVNEGVHPLLKLITKPDYGEIEKMYFIYPDKWVVFSISTSSPELFSDLDKIAQSFRYTR